MQIYESSLNISSINLHKLAAPKLYFLKENRKQHKRGASDRYFCTTLNATIFSRLLQGFVKTNRKLYKQIGFAYFLCLQG